VRGRSCACTGFAANPVTLPRPVRITIMTLRLPSLLFALLPCPGLLAQRAWEGAVDAAIRAQIERDQIPGLSCAIGVKGELAFQRGYGLADVENEVAATPATVYRLASISKPVTAVLAMQLAEQGQLDLDADVASSVPEWPQKPWPVTARQLLAHLGGVRHYANEAESTVHFARQTDALPRFATDPLLHEPGTRYHYSTYGYNLIAALVEAKTGQPFAAVVKQRIAVPCQAPSLQDDDVVRLIRGRAQGYVREGGVLRNSVLMDGSYKLGGGGLCCSADDLVRFGQALLDGRLVKPATLAAMWTRQRTKDGTEIEYGLGFRVDTKAGRRVVSHSGAQSRVSTMLLLLPEQRVAVVLLCNLEHVRLRPLADRIADLVAPPESK
jgi:serine beta-lactamase-like protein LACTB, mitochondrial